MAFRDVHLDIPTGATDGRAARSNPIHRASMGIQLLILIGICFFDAPRFSNTLYLLVGVHLHANTRNDVQWHECAQTIIALKKRIIGRGGGGFAAGHAQEPGRDLRV